MWRQFEAQFRVKEVRQIDLAKANNRDKPKKISVLEANRARNCGTTHVRILFGLCRVVRPSPTLACGVSAVITTRRVGMEYSSLRETVLTSDLTMLPAEHAELLLTYVPSSEEATALEKHSHHRDRLAEAERFMLETMALDRFESRCV